MLERARALDAADPLARYRDRFLLPADVIYLDGNSLGALPVATPDRLVEVVRQEWGEGLIRSWNNADWIGMPQRVGAKIAPLIGAAAHEVIAADSTSVNLFKLIAAALAMRPGRKVVLSEPGVHYKTGALHDMAALTRAAHEAGALVLWDLSHSAGALPVDLNGCEADLAVGCGYKYLNGGPGAPAFAFVAERHHAKLRQPLTGWMGHAAPFAFTDDYAPAEGVNRLLCGTPPILGLAALEAGIELVAEIGVERLYAKSQKLSEFFRQCLREFGVDLPLASPENPAERGSQLSFRHPDAYALSQALIARGVIGDFRDPDILRLGFAPAHLRFEDMAAAARHLSEVLNGREWQHEQFRDRAAVT